MPQKTSFLNQWQIPSPKKILKSPAKRPSISKEHVQRMVKEEIQKTTNDNQRQKEAKRNERIILNPGRNGRRRERTGKSRRCPQGTLFFHGRETARRPACRTRRASPAAAPAGQDDNPAQKTYSYEEVRQICAAKTAADNGAYKREVLDIIKKYADGKTLSKVDPSLYAGLVAEVEAIGNAR